MSERERSLVVLLAGFIGFALGAAMSGFVAASIGMSLLGHAQAGIHSDWTLVVLLGTLIAIILGGVTGAEAAGRLVVSWHG
jgi:hypothetical protein